MKEAKAKRLSSETEGERETRLQKRTEGNREKLQMRQWKKRSPATEAKRIETKHCFVERTYKWDNTIIR
jgi:hypothetical protein